MIYRRSSGDRWSIEHLYIFRWSIDDRSSIDRASIENRSKSDREAIGHLSNIYLQSIEHMSNINLSIYPTKIDRTFNEHRSIIQRASIEAPTSIYRTANEYLSNIQRTTIEHTANVCRPSQRKAKSLSTPYAMPSHYLPTSRHNNKCTRHYLTVGCGTNWSESILCDAPIVQ